MAAGEDEEFEFRLRAEQEAGASKSEPMSLWGATKGAAETAAHVGSQMAAFPVEAGASLYKLATAPSGTKIQAANQAVEDVGNAMTYQPRTAAGQTMSKGVDTVLGLPARAGDAAGQWVTDKTGSTALGAATDVGVQAIPVLLGAREASGARVAAGARAAQTATEAATRAKNYVASRTGLDWSALPDALKDTLTRIAKDAQGLDRLDPKAVERQAQLRALDLPATRGEVTRNRAQLTTEENLIKSDAGQPLADIREQQDARLTQLVDDLKASTGAKAETRTQVGQSVQGALRGKLKATKQAASKAYRFANELGENEFTTVEPLQKFLTDPINDANVGTDIRARLKAYSSEDGQISLAHLEDIRQELTAAAKTPDKSAHYAGEAVKVIDGIMDNAGSSAYKNARAGWKAMKDEFDKQGRIKKLVSEKGMSSDRATAIEDTLDFITKSPAEDIGKIKQSLIGGKSPSPAGIQAWKDVQGGVIDKLKEAAQGPGAITGEKGAPQFGAGFIKAFDEMEKDGKVEQIFTKPQADQLRKIRQAVETLRTKPKSGITGSDTVPRLINMLDKITKIPLVGDVLGGGVKAVQKLHQMGQEGRRVREATDFTLQDLQQ